MRALLRSRIFQCVIVCLFLAATGAALFLAIHPPQRPVGPVVMVITTYDGMPPESVEKTITNRIERWVNQAPGSRRIESKSLSGISIVRVYFRDDVKPDEALLTVNSLALGTLPTLPPNTLPPVVLPGDSPPLGVLAVISPPLDETHHTARVDILNMLGTVPGCVGPVVDGGKDRTVLIRLDPARMKARKLSPLDVLEALRKANVVVAPSASTHFEDAAILIDLESMIEDTDIAALNDLPLPGEHVHLRDIGRAEGSFSRQRSLVRIDGKPGTIIPLYAQAGSQPRRVAAEIEKACPGFEERLPKGTRLLYIPLERPDTLTIFLRAPSNMDLAASEKRIAEVESFIREVIPENERRGIIAEIGVDRTWSALFTANHGPQDAILRVPLADAHHTRAAEYVSRLRKAFIERPEFNNLRARFRADSASTDLRIQVTGPTEQARFLSQKVRLRIRDVEGAVDVEVLQREDAPYLLVEIDRGKVTELGLTADDVLAQVLATLGSGSIKIARQWFVHQSGNRYQASIPWHFNKKMPLEDMLDIELVGTKVPVKLSSVAAIRRVYGPVEIHHVDLKRSYDILVNRADGVSLKKLQRDIEVALQQLAVPDGVKVEVRK